MKQNYLLKQSDTSIDEMKQTILSVDFDYIMSPCINLYNQYVGGELNATRLWDRLFADLDLKEHLSYDAKSFLDIAMIMTRSVLGGAKFIPIASHDELVTDLKNTKIYEESTYDIINIDFHHDIIYDKDDLADIYDRDEYTCANWGMYLMMNDKVERYTWVKAPNSKMFDGNVIKDTLSESYLNKNIVILSERDIAKINIPFDRVYLCKSEQWVPYQYMHLYDTLCKMLTEMDKTIDRIESTPVEISEENTDRGDENA